MRDLNPPPSAPEADALSTWANLPKPTLSVYSLYPCSGHMSISGAVCALFDRLAITDEFFVNLIPHALPHVSAPSDAAFCIVIRDEAALALHMGVSWKQFKLPAAFGTDFIDNLRRLKTGCARTSCHRFIHRPAPCITIISFLPNHKSFYQSLCQ